jgi:hypothetical protein
VNGPFVVAIYPSGDKLLTLAQMEHIQLAAKPMPGLLPQTVEALIFIVFYPDVEERVDR